MVYRTMREEDYDIDDGIDIYNEKSNFKLNTE